MSIIILNIFISNDIDSIPIEYPSLGLYYWLCSSNGPGCKRPRLQSLLTRMCFCVRQDQKHKKMMVKTFTETT